MIFFSFWSYSAHIGLRQSVFSLWIALMLPKWLSVLLLLCMCFFHSTWYLWVSSVWFVRASVFIPIAFHYVGMIFICSSDRLLASISFPCWAVPQWGRHEPSYAYPWMCVNLSVGYVSRNGEVGWQGRHSCGFAGWLPVFQWSYQRARPLAAALAVHTHRHLVL